MSGGERVRFHDLPAAAFPFTVRYLDPDTGAELGRVDVAEPGAVTVPAFGRRVSVEIVWPDDTVTDWRPDAIMGPPVVGCYICEEPFTERLARRRCKGEPA